jgi:signal transduction histidine kinase
MARMLLLFLTASAVVLAGDRWRRRFGPAPRPSAIEPGDAQLEKIVRNVLFRLHAKATRQLVRLEIAIEKNLIFGGDRQALEEMLLLVCGHAIETTPCGRVLLTAHHRDGATRIAIVDDGTGMPLVHAAVALERSRETLVLLGGSLETVSRKGVGTTTTILLPPPPTEPWNATIRNTMADFARVTEPVGCVSKAPPIKATVP